MSDSDYDQRQYRRMLERLDAFESGKLGMHELINDLEGLVRALENVDEAWQHEYLGSWGGMETIRAVAIDREEKELSREDTQALHAYARELKGLVLQKIDPSRGGSDVWE